MATNSSPARILRESIETPASRATGSTPSPHLPATASATSVTVHRIVASENLPVSRFGRGVHLVHAARLGAFSPVLGLLRDLRVASLARNTRPSIRLERTYYVPKPSGGKRVSLIGRALCPFTRGHASRQLSSILGSAFISAPLQRLACFLSVVEVNRA